MGNQTGVQNVLDVAELPILASTIIAGSGVKANAAAVATIPAVPGQTAYITGFQVTAAGATAALNVTLTLAGVAGGPITYGFAFPAGAGVPAQPFVVAFYPAIPASGTGAAISVTLPAGGSGNTSASVTVEGFYQ